MGDFITRRRLLFLLIALISISLSILFLRHFIPQSRTKFRQTIDQKNQRLSSDCYRTEPTDAITLCQKCTNFEFRFEDEACRPTGYKETVLCSTSNIQTSRSCPMPIEIKKKHFWIFESLMVMISLLAVASVHSRQKFLNKQMMEKIRRQIGEMEQ